MHLSSRADRARLREEREGDKGGSGHVQRGCRVRRGGVAGVDGGEEDVPLQGEASLLRAGEGHVHRGWRPTARAGDCRAEGEGGHVHLGTLTPSRAQLPSEDLPDEE